MNIELDYSVEPDYACIGAFLDLSGLALIRFDVRSKNFLILKTQSTTDETSYQDISEALHKLALVSTRDRPNDQIYVLSNFASDLKQSILKDSYKWSDMRLMIRSTHDSMQHINDRLLTLLHLKSSGRLLVPNSEDLIFSHVDAIRKLSRAELDQNPASVPLLLSACLYSICWAEQMIFQYPNLYKTCN